MNNIFREKYRRASNRLILLDYDGTLVELGPMPEKAQPSARIVSVLRSLTKKPRTEIIIVSGRRAYDIDKFLGDLPIDIIAEHGALIKEKGKWKKQINDYGI